MNGRSAIDLSVMGISTVVAGGFAVTDFDCQGLSIETKPSAMASTTESTTANPRQGRPAFGTVVVARTGSTAGLGKLSTGTFSGLDHGATIATKRYPSRGTFAM